jgi:hypothetical protein
MLHCCPVPTRRRWLSPQFPRLGIPPLAGTPPDSFSVPSHLRCSFNAGNAANLRLSPLNSRLGRQVRRPCLSWSTYCRTAIVICKSVARSAFFRSLADPAAPSNPGARTPNSLPKSPKSDGGGGFLPTGRKSWQTSQTSPRPTQPLLSSPPQPIYRFIPYITIWATSAMIH